ncbi:MAG: GNAT family N-acetyltransferase [Syntrophaceae bacterium]|nr:GNAT family N-acetyltransferase [Syntrophaceae bacterium]
MAGAGIEFRYLTDPSEEEIQRILGLYREAGWWEETADPDPRDVTRLVAGSHCFLAAFSEGRLVAMARVLSDGVSDAYIQDVTVEKTMRHRGIGSRLIQTIVERLNTEGIRWIGLIATGNTEDFYRPLGFRPVPGALAMLQR